MQNRFFMLVAVAGLQMFSCNNPEKQHSSTGDSTLTATNATSESEWISLFDGKTTAGWHNYGKQTIGASWVVDSGALHLDASRKKDWQSASGGDILTNDTYENFELQLEWKIAKNGNSGIIFQVHEDTAKYQYPWMTGPEMQVLDNNGHPDAKITKHRAGDLYDLITSSPEVVKPAGEWNAVRLIADKGNLQFYLNGNKVVETTQWDNNWRNMIAGSKFKTFKDFGTYKRGAICLQDHGDNVWYRNIRIKNL